MADDATNARSAVATTESNGFSRISSAMSRKCPTPRISTRRGLTAGAHPSQTCRRRRAAVVGWPRPLEVLPLPPTNRKPGLLRAKRIQLYFARLAVPLPAPRDHRAVAGGANAGTGVADELAGTNGQLAAIAGGAMHLAVVSFSTPRRVASRRVGPVGPRRYRASDWGSLRIRTSKFHKSRLVPLSPTANDALRAYLRQRLAAPFDTGIRNATRCCAAGATGIAGYTGCWLGSGHQPRLLVAADVLDAEGRRPRCPRYEAQLRGPGPDALVSRRRRRPVQPATPGDLHGACLDRVDRPLPALRAGDAPTCKRPLRRSPSAMSSRR